MKRSAIVLALTLICLGPAGTTSGQQSCDFDIVGTWRASTSDGKDSPWLYQFTPDGTVAVLTRAGSGGAPELRVVARAKYDLDDARTPASITFTATGNSDVFAYGATSMEITGFDDVSFTCVVGDSAPARWIRVDPHRYFIVLAARSGEFYDASGSALSMLIRMAGAEPQVDAVGTYSQNGARAFGPVPPDVYKAFMSDAGGDTEVMLRLEINTAQYQRALKILKTWERRVRENATLYPAGSPLNNVLLVKAFTETLNQCSNDVALYELSYHHPADWISEKYPPQAIPFMYFKELRRLNEARHVTDVELPNASLVVQASIH